jgi:hypothetical protein
MQLFNSRPKAVTEARNLARELQSTLSKMEAAVHSAKRWQAKDSARRKNNPPIRDTIFWLVHGINRYCVMGNVALEMKAKAEEAMLACESAAAELAAKALAARTANQNPFRWQSMRRQVLRQIPGLRQCIQNLSPSIAAASEGFNHLAQRIGIFYPVVPSEPAKPRVVPVESK